MFTGKQLYELYLALAVSIRYGGDQTAWVHIRPHERMLWDLMAASINSTIKSQLK
jgi:hypothetical protein